jgi:hypothetical protein
MPFEWLALLAYRRTGHGSGSVTVDDVAKLPHWRKTPRRDIITYLGRYLGSPGLTAAKLVIADKRWAGPYKLNVDPRAIQFDISDQDVRQRLQLPSKSSSETHRGDLLRFAMSYIRAQWLFFQGRLNLRATGSRARPTAYKLLMQLTEDPKLGSTLRQWGDVLKRVKTAKRRSAPRLRSHLT